MSSPEANQSFTTLKDILVKPEKEKIKAIEQRLDDPMTRAREISQSLPQAISMSVIESDRISRVIEPVIDASLKASVQNNPKAIADAIFPALGPGIRKAISATILGMIQSLNQVLNHSFSLQGLKWRYEAFKTRKPFAEVVLLNTLVYQVEQIFLIHRQSGIVLEHVVTKDAIIQDPDLVSAMLTAIQDFVKDSFSTDTQDELETLRTGSDRSIWIEQGEHALIAAVIRGTPPLDLRLGYRELLEDIHIRAGRALEQFNGDPSPFAVFREQLKDGLSYKEKKNQKKISPWLILLFATLIAGLGFWGIKAYSAHRAWAGFLDRLEREKGLIVIGTDKKNGRYRVRGLADSLARDPASLLTESDRKKIRVSGHWQTFYSLDPAFVIQRANDILSPPPGVTLSVSDQVVRATGRAPQDWIRLFMARAPAVPGIVGADGTGLESIEKQALDTAVSRLTSLRILFKNNTSQFVDGQEAVLEQLVGTVQTIAGLQQRLNTPFSITVMGHTDSYGSEKHNLELSRKRAEVILNHLVVAGINPALLTLTGVGPRMLLKNEDTEEDRAYNRAVSFKIFYIEPR